MKRALIWIIGILTILTAVLIVCAYAFTGDRISAEKSLYVQAPPSVTYNHVANLRSWEKWSPWAKMDPNMKIEYQNGGQGKGASYSFDSELKNLGNGKLTITDTHKNKTVKTFVIMNDNEGIGTWDFTQKGKGSIVTWNFSFEPQNLFERVMGLFFERMMGPNLEKGLENLKVVAEKTPPPGYDVGASLQKRMQQVRDSIKNAGIKRPR